MGGHLRRASVSETSAIPRGITDTAADVLAGALFIGFVGLLFWGYLDPGLPFSEISAVPFVGSLATVLWANVLADRRSCAVPLTPEPMQPSG